jgi:hypothetical protein
MIEVMQMEMLNVAVLLHAGGALVMIALYSVGMTHSPSQGAPHLTVHSQVASQLSLSKMRIW